MHSDNILQPKTGCKKIVALILTKSKIKENTENPNTAITV
jgi:hypothetical protein